MYFKIICKDCNGLKIECHWLVLVFFASLLFFFSFYLCCNLYIVWICLNESQQFESKFPLICVDLSVMGHGS